MSLLDRLTRAVAEKEQQGAEKPAAESPVVEYDYRSFEYAAVGIQTKREGLAQAEEDTLELYPSQREALLELRQSPHGGFLPMGVGSGKTYTGFLAPSVLDCDMAVVFVPPRCLNQSRRDYDTLSQHFELVETHWVKYSTLSQLQWDVDRLTLLQKVSGRRCCFVFDEAHYLKHTTSARTKRVLRLLGDVDEVTEKLAVVVMSGTLLNGLPTNYHHLAAASLREGSWLPTDRKEFWAWQQALQRARDPKQGYVFNVPKALSEKIPGPPSGFNVYRSEEVLKAYHQLVSATPGVVFHGGDELGTALYLQDPQLPNIKGKLVSEELKQMYDQAALGIHPDGHELGSPTEVAATLKTLALGFYYYWDWRGSPDFQWLAARNEWSRQCREAIQQHEEHGYDTPMRVVQGLEAGRLTDKHLQSAWDAWKAVKDRSDPETKTRWVDETIMRAVLTKARKEPMIVWYGHRAVADWLARHGLETFFAGDEVEADGACSIALSLGSHRTGLNLQEAFNVQLFTAFPTSAEPWEQAIGRCHRARQPADEVTVYVPRHASVFRRSLTKALEDAKSESLVSGGRPPQKLLQATKLF